MLEVTGRPGPMGFGAIAWLVCGLSRALLFVSLTDAGFTVHEHVRLPTLALSAACCYAVAALHLYAMVGRVSMSVDEAGLLRRPLLFCQLSCPKDTFGVSQTSRPTQNNYITTLQLGLFNLVFITFSVNEKYIKNYLEYLYYICLVSFQSVTVHINCKICTYHIFIESGTGILCNLSNICSKYLNPVL